MAKKKNSTPDVLKFNADGDEYQFKSPSVNIPGKGVLTAKQCMEDEEALAILVSKRSGVIRRVEPSDSKSKGGK